uniref:Uncharacterized protein n=1 Tax=viral metagenome TaxID=1070528 RepID=A0A6M3LMW2_9ZZZZ
MTGIELVKEYFPDATDEFADHVLWARTGFPCFYPADIGIEEYLRREVQAFKVLYDAKKDICELCNSEATVGLLCHKCHEAIYQKQDQDAGPG